MRIQEYLDNNYPTENQKRELKELVLNNRNLSGELTDLSDFWNLEEIDLGKNSISGNLNIFTNLIKLKDLRINGNDNNFSGSLFDLRNLNLKYLDISENREINGDIDSLPFSLKTFECRKTVFSRVMKPFNYDLEAWRLVLRPQLFADEEWKEKVDKKIEENELYLSTAGDNLNVRRNSRSNDISYFHKKELRINSKVVFLKSMSLKKEVELLGAKIEDLEINLESSHPDLMDADKVSWYSKIYPELYDELKQEKGEKRIELSDFIRLLEIKNQKLEEKLQSEFEIIAQVEQLTFKYVW